MNTPILGISCGDINGIGIEVTLKAIRERKILSWCTPILYAGEDVVKQHLETLELKIRLNTITDPKQAKKGEINLISPVEGEVKVVFGEQSREAGQYAINSLSKATNDLKEGLIDALITAPINKKSVNLAGFKHPGHTEFLTKTLEAHESLMFMISDDLRVGLVTNHVPVKDIAVKVSKKEIIKKLKIMHKSIERDFGITNPKIALLGLNPHAGDDGVIGSEDKEVIMPAILEAKKQNIMAFGPFPADGFFGSGAFKKYDAVLAMYHDQGLVPFKTLAFGNGVNFTAGLSGVRTSPDHGTGFDIAGQNKGDAASFRNAIYLALDVVKHQNNYDDMHANPMKRGRRVD